MTLLGRVDVKFKSDDKTDVELWSKLEDINAPRTKVLKEALRLYLGVGIEQDSTSAGQLNENQIARMVEKIVEEKLAAKVSAVPVEKEENTKPQKKPGLMLGKKF